MAVCDADVDDGQPGTGTVDIGNRADKMDDQEVEPLKRTHGSSAEPLAATRHTLVNYRKAASDFLQATTGIFVPFSTDTAFRSALRDGVLLCRLASTVWGPGTIQYLEVSDAEPGPEGFLQQQTKNLVAFSSALQQQVPALPTDCQFSIDDLMADGEDERPQVVNCLLYIRSDCAQAPITPVGQLPVTPPAHPRSSSGTASRHQCFGTPPVYPNTAPRLSYGGTPMANGSPNAALVAPNYSMSAGMQQRLQMSSPSVSSSPLTDGYSSLSHAQHAAGGSVVPGRSAYGVPAFPALPSGGYTKSLQTATHMTKLMQQCTNMLKGHMFSGEQGGSSGSRHSPAGAECTMKALGPVLEGVLGHLTEEYEKRLLAKDHELSRKNDERAKLEKEVLVLKEEVQQLKQAAESRSAAVTRAAADASAADVAELRQQLAETQAAPEANQKALAAAQARLDSADMGRETDMLRLQVEVQQLHGQLQQLQDVQDRYKRVVEENRTLYNTVQDLRGNIRVFCRIRPPGATGDLSPSCVDAGLEGDLAIYDAHNGNKRVYKVDRVFDQSIDQVALYEDTQPLIRSVLDGYNVCIFAYGQTGSGKTHTMSGTDTMHLEGRGINYRALDDLFAIRNARREEVDYCFKVQMLEIYNESLRDLLLDSRCNAANRLDILATQASGCNVPGATQFAVDDAQDVATLMARGASNRATSETKMNDRSSRSHQILTVIVDGFNHVTKAQTHGCLHLIDLAGSERVGKSEASGDRLVEAQHINKSLSALGDVMAALASKDRHVPFRNSKLTQLLQDSLQGNAKVMMFMHVSPEANMYGESVSTLKFATRVSEITLGQAKKNVVSGKVFEAHEDLLKQQRSMESKEQEIQQLQAARQRDQQEMYQLRCQLEEARMQAAGASAAAPAAQQRSGLRLPIQQMLADQQQQAAIAAAKARNTGGAELLSVRGELAGLDSPASISKIARLDGTPQRDQDEATLTSAHSVSGLDLSPLSGHARCDGSSMQPTPRSAQNSAGGQRESTSQHRHLERLKSARQSGTFRAAPASSSTARASSTGGRQTCAEISNTLATNLKEQASKLGAAANGGGSSRHSLALPLPTSRSNKHVDVSMPLTARVSGAVRSRVSDVTSMPPMMSARQSGVFGRNSSTTASITTSSNRPSGAMTCRGGSRWK